MAILEVTLKVNTTELFDALVKEKGDTKFIGNTIVAAIMTDDKVTLGEQLIMTLYGVEVVNKVIRRVEN